MIVMCLSFRALATILVKRSFQAVACQHLQGRSQSSRRGTDFECSMFKFDMDVSMGFSSACQLIQLPLIIAVCEPIGPTRN
jgi:hypothetical protein